MAPRARPARHRGRAPRNHRGRPRRLPGVDRVGPPHTSQDRRSRGDSSMNASARNSERDVVLASADAALRQRLRDSLTGLRWGGHAASGGAEALTLLEHQPSDALLTDGWLPDLEAAELAG